MSDARLYVHVLLDRSGSMESCRDRTIDAFNEYVGALRHQSRAGTRLSLTTFDSEGLDLVFDTRRIDDVGKLTRETFVPRAMTPLFDAIGATVAKIDTVTLLPGERVAFAILTDGHENASREHSADSVKKLLEDRQKRLDWLVLYLGANQDAWDVGERIGVGAGQAMSYDTVEIMPALSAVSASMARYRRTPLAKDARRAAAFTEAERAAAKGGSRNKA